MPLPSYAAMRDYCAPARSHARIWRLLVGAVVFIVTYVVPMVGLFALVGILLGPDRSREVFEGLAAIDTPAATLIVLFSFVFMTLAVWAAARLMHKRGLASLIGPLGPALRDFIRVTGAMLVLQGVFFLLPFGKADMVANLPLSTWAMLLPLTAIGIFVQTSAEELVFRGYLQQQLAARFASPLVWLLGPSILFGLVHYDPATMGDNTWVVIAWAAIFGLSAADLTARAGNIGPAVGLHFANNFGAMTLVSLDGPLSGLSLFKLPFSGADTEVLPTLLWLDLGAIGVMWLLARLVIRR